MISEDTKRIERNITESKDKTTDSPVKTSIKFGIFDWIDRNQLTLPELYEQRLKLIECAEEKGFYCYHIAEHHGSPLNMTPSPSYFSGGCRSAHHAHPSRHLGLRSARL